jgi:hypothetical protein
LQEREPLLIRNFQVEFFSEWKKYFLAKRKARKESKIFLGFKTGRKGFSLRTLRALRETAFDSGLSGLGKRRMVPGHPPDDYRFFMQRPPGGCTYQSRVKDIEKFRG